MFFTRYFFKKKFNRKFVVNHHHEKICNALERVLMGECKRLIINIAPRYGKTELAVKNFIAHAIALNPSAKFIHLSYSDDLALDNSEEIRDLITSDYFQELYPEIGIKKDSNSKKKWYTSQGGGVYATSSSGQVTGFGAGKVDEEEEQKEIDEFISGISEKEGFGGAIVIDDPIKPDDAESPTIRNRVNNKYDSTIKNRVNSRNTPIIVIMQRLHPDDLCGHLINNDNEEWEVLSLPCIYEENGVKKALWDFKHTLEELMTIRGKTNASISIFDRQYLQNPKPIGGLLYNDFNTYQSLPDQVVMRKNYTDTADTGDDYLCSISYDVGFDGLAYVVDVKYTQQPMEITEPLISGALLKYRVNYADIESNNGGRGFARKISEMTGDKCCIDWFHQSANKESRIISNAATVMQKIVFPDDWHLRWPDFYMHVTNFKRKFKANEHDDAPDALTGVVERMDFVNSGSLTVDYDDL